ncbi:hypothetical protein LBMAG52_44710 [Planctomycetia bacterium]|nr:hypothetical protein LBMAG52_44710 [Planctomycetia bacterium]
MVCNLFSRWICGKRFNLKRRRPALPWRGNQRSELLEDRTVPATITVTTFADVVNPADGKISLREAISQANATPAVDNIVLKAGIYSIEQIGADENGNATGDFDITRPVIITGAGDGKTIIDGDDLDRVFDIEYDGEDTVTVSFVSLTIRNGLAGDGSGGGIRADVDDDGTVNVALLNASVRDNIATDVGGGIANFQGSVTLTNSFVSGNLSGSSGGGIFVDEGNVTLTTSVVSGNTAGTGGHERRRGSDANGGGIAVIGGSVLLTGAPQGAATVKGASSVIDNVAADEGGGIWTTDEGTVTVEKLSSVRDNTARAYAPQVVAII